MAIRKVVMSLCAAAMLLVSVPAAHAQSTGTTPLELYGYEAMYNFYTIQATNTWLQQQEQTLAQQEFEQQYLQANQQQQAFDAFMNALIFSIFWGVR